MDDKFLIGLIFGFEELEPRDPLINPYWLVEDPTLPDGRINSLHKIEIHFWELLIKKYLTRIDANPEKEVDPYFVVILLRLRYSNELLNRKKRRSN